MTENAPDVVLKWIKSNKGWHSIDEIVKGTIYGQNDIKRVLLKLTSDGNVDIRDVNGSPMYTISFDGLYFKGYQKKKTLETINFYKELFKFSAVIIGAIGVVITTAFTILTYFDSKKEDKLDKSLESLQRRIELLECQDRLNINPKENIPIP